MERKEIDLYQPKRQAINETKLEILWEDREKFTCEYCKAYCAATVFGIIAFIEALVIISIW